MTAPLRAFLDQLRAEARATQEFTLADWLVRCVEPVVGLGLLFRFAAHCTVASVVLDGEDFPTLDEPRLGLTTAPVIDAPADLERSMRWGAFVWGILMATLLASLPYGPMAQAVWGANIAVCVGDPIMGHAHRLTTDPYPIPMEDSETLNTETHHAE